MKTWWSARWRGRIGAFTIQRGRLVLRPGTGAPADLTTILGISDEGS
jgi:hypothetical protein